MIPVLTFIDRQLRRTIIMLRDQRRHFRLIARRIANLLVVSHPTLFRLSISRLLHPYIV